MSVWESHCTEEDALNVSVTKRSQRTLKSMLYKPIKCEMRDAPSFERSYCLFIAELVARLMKRDGTSQDGTFNPRNLRGLKNTAWTKVQVTFNVCYHFSCSSTTMIHSPK